MTLITEQYREQQKILHADEKNPYGVASASYAPMVARIIDQYGINTLLDYGAGSRLTLIKTISEQRLVKRKFDYRAYEPAVEMYSKTPEPAEMVACIDVLEHIEPDCLDAVLDDLKRVTINVGLFTVSCGPARKFLSDGRNAHLIQEEPEWWLPKITDRFLLQTFQRTQDGFIVLVSPVRDHVIC
jgi:hypothetical protein